MVLWLCVKSSIKPPGYRTFLVFFILSGVGKSYPVNAQDLLQYVQPLSGTAPATTAAALKHSEGTEKNANTIPATGLPFGMTQWTPQTRTGETKCIPPYYYNDSLFSGIRGTHWISGSCMQDYGSFTIMPVCGELKTVAKEYAVAFSHGQETTTPAYYKLHLPAYDLTTEVTATSRCGMLQFTMLRDDSLHLLALPNSDLGKGWVQVDATRGLIKGYNPVHRIYQGWGQPAGFNGYFFIEIEKAIEQSGVFRNAEIIRSNSIGHQKNIGAFVSFKLKKGEQVRIRIGTSFTGIEGAEKNLRAEIPAWDFQQVLLSAQKNWQTALGRIWVQTANEKYKRIFYTALWHALQQPRLYNDVDGAYPKFAQQYQTGKLSGGGYYDDFSMWDIYRAQLPLAEILYPAKVGEWVQSMILKGQQGGWLPIFPCWNNYTAAMIGDHVTAFIASACNKGINNYDVQEAYRLMRQNAFASPPAAGYSNGMGRRALQSYLGYGFIPLEDSVPEAFHKKEQVSRTLEYAYNDYALSEVAKRLKKKNDYRLLRKRALNYRNIFDTSVGMVRGKYAGGKWLETFQPDNRASYITEGTPRQYTFYVPQDIPGLAALMGGRDKLEAALDSLFGKNEYWHGNEPGHQIPFLYNYTASPWKTQQQVLNILQEEYSDGAGGLSGNDDAGQMSAWYVFASMGFYPVNPVSGEYLLCSPVFDKAVISLPGNKKLEIIAHKKKENDRYIALVKWNGKRQDNNYTTYKEMMKGGKLEIWLQSTPANWGAQVQHQPGGLK